MDRLYKINKNLKELQFDATDKIKTFIFDNYEIIRYSKDWCKFDKDMHPVFIQNAINEINYDIDHNGIIKFYSFKDGKIYFGSY
jgi:hypothetical protein